ncbi:MAG: glucans biosynthesis glucosyltransferase MdoH [Rhodocyclaceae bacterium]|nr:glucans biosynthesis glucosyltransferase MdoH [Rhodocyclaceae bacterium]
MSAAGGVASCGWYASARRRRWLLAALVALQTAGACYAMLGVLPYHGSTGLERAIVAVAAILFGWISAGFWTALFGFVIRRRGGDPLSPGARFPDARLQSVALAPTAIVFPIYHEDVQRTLAGLRATWRDAERTGQIGHFTFFVLSDSRNPAIWLREREACQRVRDELGAQCRLYYRRRAINLNRKTGNVADFLRRWGRHFRYMIVMDADSVMQGAALVRMVRVMQSDPVIGILQSAPTLINAVSAHARIQQFATRLYGPLFTDGLATLQLGEAVFWGHNAIIRVDAFMRHCGLRHLRGWGFLRGAVLSHDFVEAACIRRAGYEVWLDPSLEGSYEESPPTLVDELERDRRWAHGNLQHLYFLFRRGVAGAHRMAFANGIMAYLASALWFAYLVMITFELAQFTLRPIEYFPNPNSPFPVWPEWQPQWAINLAAGTVFVLFAPKLLALVDVACDPPRRVAMGGLLRITLGMLLEMLVSILLSPIRMLSHTRYVLVTLLNISVRWAGQNRTDETGWLHAFIHHAPGALLALGWAGFAYWLQPLFFYWSLPIAVPLVLAAPVSVWLSRFGSGRALRRARLLLIADETDPPAVVQDLQAAPALAPSTGLSAFEAAVIDPQRNRFHVALAHPRRDTTMRQQRRQMLVERALADGASALSAAEQAWLVDDGRALAELHDAVWRAPHDSRWHARVETASRAGVV